MDHTNSMRRVCMTWTVCVVLLMVPTALWAQATITGTARDTSGAVLPGVTVEAASPALIERALKRLRGTVRGFDLSVADTERLLWEWAGDRPGWTIDWIAAKVDRRPPAAFDHAKSPGDRRADEGGIADGGERHERGAVGEVAGQVGGAPTTPSGNTTVDKVKGVVDGILDD